MTETMDQGQDEERKPPCPVCHSSDIIRIPDEEKVYGLGLYGIHGFLGGGVDKVFRVYRCLQCYYEW